MAVIFSGNSKVRVGEYGVYFIGADFNCFDAPSFFELRMVKNKLDASPWSAVTSSKYIWITFNKDDLVKTFENVINFATEKRMKEIAIPCPLMKLEGIIAVKQLLCDLAEDINVRIIIKDKHLKYVNQENNQFIYGFIRRNYRDPNIRYSIDPSPESIERAERTRKGRKERYKQSIDYTNHVKLSIDDLKKELGKHELNLEKTFSDMLFEMINEKHMSDVEVYKRANLDRKHFSKIRSNSDYKPSKETALSLCIALRLNIEETDFLLNTIGVSLSRSNLSDMIVRAFILNEIYDIDQLNLCLLERNLKPLTYY